MYSGNPDVPDDVFADVLKQINHFVRDRVVPRELEIMTTDMGLPADIAAGMLESGADYFTAGMEFDTAGLDTAGAWVFDIGKSSKAYTAADYTLTVD